MRNLPIAYGNSCYAKRWANKTITFDALCTRLETTIRTSETQEEYPKLAKVEKDRIKDKGGFVAGLLKDNLRRVETVISRSMISLDADKASKDLIENFTSIIKYKACLYTTHSHTTNIPRCRIIIPLLRDVTPDEYVAISRYLASDLGIDMFDECSYRVHQLMYWPTTPSNGEYIFKETTHQWLDPDIYLGSHPNWRDFSLLPTSSKESILIKPSGKKAGDPLAKKGIIGAFCKAYSITEALETFLSNIYQPSKIEGRYDYIPGTSAAGVLIYDDKFIYSHHASDPIYGRLLNSFDLVRIHLFGKLDEETPESITKAPSYTEMISFALNDEKVKQIITKEKLENAGIDFKDNIEWSKKLELDRKGNILDSLNNLVLIILNDENLQDIKYNLLTSAIEVIGSVPWQQNKPGWSDIDFANLKVYISNAYKIYAPNKSKDALLSVAANRSFHPIKDYFASLPKWDGESRVDEILIKYLGAEDSEYTRAVTRKTLIAAVARIYEPGIKFDSVPILNGPQGIGKSTLFSYLGKAWFSDSLTLTDMKDKAGAEKLQGYWILELGELAGMKKADIETVKSFISRNDDKYRVSYGINVESHLRQCIIVGTTNAENGFLRDITGNRRFWPVEVSGNSELKPWHLTKNIVDQIWAETLIKYYLGENLFLEGELAKDAQLSQSKAMESDDREGLVKAYLDTPIPKNWDDLDLGERRDFISGFGSEVEGYPREKVCNLEIWCECFQKNAADLKKSDSYEIAAIMRKMNDWTDKRSDGQSRYLFKIYGRQRYYHRIKEEK